ncbi:Hypothetical protein PENO1_079540 [Penicillium occitanis (nom. inval.)]|nr:hypothetical protein PENOC_086280 [Penicillium occitanis (nom. inval.)]PCG94249.1 Hypothetical protein PENO1_079540 [Penicillium occitanis (nom. inval.)]
MASRFPSVTKPEVHPPPAKDSRASLSTQRETRSSAKKRNADQITEEGEDVTRCGSPDSYYQETSADAEESSPVQMKGPKKVRKSSSANSQAAWKKNLQDRLKASEVQRKTLGNQIKKLETSLKNVTKESVLNARRGAKGVWDQSKVETEWKILKRDIKSWVKKHGTTRKILTFSDDAKKDILSTCVSDCYREVFSEDNFGIIQELPKGAQLLLEGFLYAHAVQYLIARPFLFVDSVLQEHSMPSKAILGFGNYETMFEDFAESLAKCDSFPDQAQRWTASMLQSLKRLIIPDPSDDIASQREADKKAMNSFRIYELGIAQLANEFTLHKKAVKHLLDDRALKKDCEVRRDELKIIYRKFRELAYHMWCQPFTINYYYGMDLFDPEVMELDPTAAQARQDMGMDMMKGSKVLVRICPRIRGEIVDPVNKKRKAVDFLRQKVWTIDCQTYAQWKASQKESTSEGHPSQTTSESVTHNDGLDVTENTLIDDRSASEAQIQESKKDADDTTASPPDANSDTVQDFPGAQEPDQSASDAEQAHSTGSPDTSDAMKQDDLDAMEER